MVDAVRQRVLGREAASVIRLTELVSRCPVPVELHINADRHLPAEYEVALYYVVSEALTNVIKHAQAAAVRIDLDQKDSQIGWRSMTTVPEEPIPPRAPAWSV